MKKVEIKKTKILQQILAGNMRKRLFRFPRCDLEDNIKMDSNMSV